MKLAVLIPTYNGGAFLRRAVLAHVAQLRTLEVADVEIVISDNASCASSLALARDLALGDPNVRLLEQRRHLNTAEEHLFVAAGQLEHEYLWTFGDDDLPAQGALAQVYNRVQRGDTDLIIGNIRAFQAGVGTFFPGRNAWGGIVGTEEDLFGRVQDLVAQVGYQSVAACISALVFRRETFVSAPFGVYRELSPIYAHVACCLDAFAGRRACFLARPVVNYRFGATPDAHWRAFAEAQQKPVNRPWTYGIVGHLELLSSRGKIDVDFPARVREHHPDHTFALWAHVFSRVIDDMETGAFPGPAHPSVAHDLDRLCMIFGAGEDPMPLEIAARLKSVWLGLGATADGTAGGRGAADDAAAPGESLASVHASLAPALQAFPVSPASAKLSASSYQLGDWIDLSQPASSRFLRSGFSDPEPWGRWTIGKVAQMALPTRGLPPVRCVLELDVASIFERPGMTEEHAPELWIDDGPRLSLRDVRDARVTLPVRVTAAAPEMIVHIAISEPKRPEDPPAGDDRELGVGLARMRLTAA